MVTIHPLTLADENDIDVIIDLNVKGLLEFCGDDDKLAESTRSYWTVERREKLRKKWLKHVVAVPADSRTQYNVWVARIDSGDDGDDDDDVGRIIGTLEVKKRDPRCAEQDGLQVDNVFVDAGWRRRGVFRSLLARAEAAAVAAGKPSLHLITQDNLRAALNAYRCCGFVENTKRSGRSFGAYKLVVFSKRLSCLP
jgi:GNAT superfamily N-acetyltransferase